MYFIDSFMYLHNIYICSAQQLLKQYDNNMKPWLLRTFTPRKTGWSIESVCFWTKFIFKSYFNAYNTHILLCLKCFCFLSNKWYFKLFNIFYHFPYKLFHLLRTNLHIIYLSTSFYTPPCKYTSIYKFQRHIKCVITFKIYTKFL